MSAIKRNVPHAATSPAPASTASAHDSLPKKPTSTRKDVIDLIGCSASIYFCYVLYGIVQERIYDTKYDGEQFNYSLFLVLCQCLANALVAFVVMLFYSQPNDTTPHMEYFKISFAYIGAMFSSNYALNFVSYPTQALGKSCKMIPVMIMGVVINNKHYKKREWLTVLMITIGISMFMLFKSSKKETSQASSWFGLLLLFASLILDGFVGPNQERIIAKHNPSMHQLMLHMNLHAVWIVFAAMLVTNGFFPAVEFCQRHPEVWFELFLFSLASAVGQNFILVTLYRFSSLVLTIITTTRKFFTLLASVIWFRHVLNWEQWLGVALVFIGLGVDTYHKHQKKQKEHADYHHAQKKITELQRTTNGDDANGSTVTTTFYSSTSTTTTTTTTTTPSDSAVSNMTSPKKSRPKKD